MAFSEQQHYGWGPGEAIHQVDDYRSSPLVTNHLSALKLPAQVRDDLCVLIVIQVLARVHNIMYSWY